LAVVPDPTVSLVVVNYNSGDLTGRLLDAVGGGADEVIVVDNDSPDGGAGLDEASARHPKADVLRLARNLGYGGGANAGAHRATGSVVVISNADIVISGPDLRALAAQVSNGVVLAAPRFLTPDGELEQSAHRREPRFLATIDSYCGPFGHVMRRWRPGWHPSWYSAQDHERDFDCLHVLGALMAIDRREYEAVGGFDESFFMYREETDLCRRLRQRGGRIRHVGTIVARHVGRASTPSRWPYQGNVMSLDSHYHYIRKHWGRIAGGAARALGTVSCAVWLIAGPAQKRPVARRALRWHVGLPVEP
jgi:N-acetylglucosaminyl-diphospho-decaprenol L-rhamnosyltransferase